jgi:predicted ArsR family transcriptional regulator
MTVFLLLVLLLLCVVLYCWVEVKLVRLRRRYIVMLLHVRGEMSPVEIAREVGMVQGTVYPMMRELEDRGLVLHRVEAIPLPPDRGYLVRFAPGRHLYRATVTGDSPVEAA